MKKIAFLGAALLLAATIGPGYAQHKGGASEFSPGDRMQDSGGVKSKGASKFAPGHEMHKKSSGGASEFSPGDKMNDIRR